MPLPPAHRAALRILAERLRGAPLDWALTGSASFAIQGLDLTPGDIDIQTDAAGAYALAARLADAVARPVRLVESPAIRSHFGALSLAGVTVEIMGAIQKRLPGGAWEPPVDIRPHRVWVPLDGGHLPALDLAYEARAYRLLGRVARADLLDAHLARLGNAPPTGAGR